MKRWQLWLGIAISAVLLFLAFRGLDFLAILNTIQSANYIWIIPAVLIYMFGLWLRTLRWQVFINPLKKIPLKELFKIVSIGYMGNNIYPARMGELVRAYILKREEDIAISASIATILIERIFDGLIMLGFILLNISVINQMSHGSEIRTTVNAVSLWSAIIFIVAFAIFLISALIPKRSAKFIKTIFRFLLPEKILLKINPTIDKFFNGIKSLASPATTISTFFLSAAIWILEAIFYWFVMQALPLHVEFRVLILMVGFLNLFTIIPSSPGYIGTFDAPSIAILSSLGINQQVAAGYTLLLHAALWLPVTLIGVYFFAQKGLNWNEAIERAKKDHK